MTAATVSRVNSGVGAGSVALGPAVPSDGNALEQDVTITAADGLVLAGSLCLAEGKRPGAGVVLVHASSHERDAYGDVSIPGLPQSLRNQGIATLRFDIRGRGGSLGKKPFQSMAPGEREAVRLDVKAAVDYLARRAEVVSNHIAIVAEQDSANPAVIAGSRDKRVVAFVLISGRLSQAAKIALSRGGRPVFCLVSKEDRRGFRDMVDAYLAAKSRQSRIRVFEGLALGTTMFSVWRHEHSAEEPIEDVAADWLASRLRFLKPSVSGKKSAGERRRSS